MLKTNSKIIWGWLEMLNFKSRMKMRSLKILWSWRRNLLLLENNMIRRKVKSLLKSGKLTLKRVLHLSTWLKSIVTLSMPNSILNSVKSNKFNRENIRCLRFLIICSTTAIPELFRSEMLWCRCKCRSSSQNRKLRSSLCQKAHPGFKWSKKKWNGLKIPQKRVVIKTIKEKSLSQTCCLK